jgi:tRNA(Arg) A34 adenosine deaminase TadA
MCLGAIHWSGLTEVVCGARDEDVRSIGFDEGHKPPDWSALLAQWGIGVQADVLRADAVAVAVREAARPDLVDDALFPPLLLHRY